jgi:uncharacterized protein YydD (DUF2326 family)
MYLEKLTIRRLDETIRVVPFKSGLNLILDSPTRTNTESGNSIGKSTVLKLIDFCLGSDGQDIWMDEEFKKLNEDIVEFLLNPEPVSIDLELKSTSGRSHIFTRTFVAPGVSGIMGSIDEKPYKKIGEYCSAVRTILFGSDAKKPSLRQLMPKFVRSSPQKMNRTLFFSGPYTGKTEYESIHLFLFGFFNVEVLEERPKLITAKKRITRDLETLKRLKSEGEVEQLILHLKSEIEEKESILNKAGESSDFPQKVIEVGRIREKAARISERLSAYQAELNYQKRTIAAFDLNKDKIDLNLVRQLYEEAKAYIPTLQKDFIDLSNFVDNLKLRKLEFLKAQLPQTQQIVTSLQRELEELDTQEKSALTQIKNESKSSDYASIKEALRNHYLQLGGLEEASNNYKKLHEKEKENEEALARTQQRLEDGKQKLRECVQTFNKYFTRLSKTLYEEAYILHFDEDKNGAFEFSIAHVGANVGTGKKATQTAAFDLAYVQFLNEKKFGFPKFILHDGLEAIHDNQLRALLETISNTGGQLVIATLRGKLPDLPEGFLATNTIVELSQQDKLFRH